MGNRLSHKKCNCIQLQMEELANKIEALEDKVDKLQETTSDLVLEAKFVRPDSLYLSAMRQRMLNYIIDTPEATEYILSRNEQMILNQNDGLKSILTKCGFELDSDNNSLFFIQAKKPSYKCDAEFPFQV